MNVDRYIKKLLTFCAMGRHLCELSACRRARCGALLFSTDCQGVLSIGYNGPAAGLPHDECRPDLEGGCGCLHAELNALTKAEHGRPCILYTTYSPCRTCAAHIVNHGSVVAVLYDVKYRKPGEGIDLLERSGIDVVRASDIQETGYHDRAFRWRVAGTED